MAWGIGWTLIRALKSLKNCTLMGSSYPKHMFQLENFRRTYSVMTFYVMKLKGDAKFKGKLAQGLKNNARELVNFHASSWKSENLHFDGLFLSKGYKDLEEKVQKSYICLMTLKSDAKFEEKLTLVSKNDMRNLVSFNVSSGKSENLHFNVLLLTIPHKVSARKVQRNSLSWHWKEIQPLQKNWLFVWKMVWGIWWTLTRAAESLKISTLMGYFCRKYTVVLELKKYRGVASWKMM